MVREGYRLSGIFPIDVSVIMSGWSGWSMCNRQQATGVLARIPQLTNIAKEKVRVTDMEIEECMSGVLTFDPATRKSEDCALNHSRCLWTNNEKVIEAHQKKLQDDLMKSIQKENRKKEKEDQLQSRNEAATNRARERGGDEGADESGQAATQDSHSKPTRVYKCSNTLCNAVGSKIDRKDWTGCRI